MLKTDKKILIIAPQPFYKDRGTPMNVRLMATVLGNAGYRVDLLVFPTGDDLEMKGVRVLRLPNFLRTQTIPIGFSWKKLVLDLPLAIYALFLALRNRYQVIHGIEEGGVIAAVLARLLRKASIFDMDSVMSEQLGAGKNGRNLVQKIVAMLEKWSLRNSSVIITVCQSLSDTARASTEDGNIVQIEDIPLSFAFPLDPGRKEEIDRQVAAIERQHGLDTRSILLYTGNLQPYQGIDLLLEAWGFFIDNNRNWQDYCLVIAGGPESLAASCKARIQGSFWHDSVVFLGPRPLEEMERWMSSAACLISPRSQGENTPLKIYSYMATGKPIIATRMHTHTQVLDDQTAFLVEPDARDMAAAIAHAFKNEEQGLRKGRAALDKVRRQYSYEIFSKKLLEAYAQAVGGTTP